LAGLTSAPDHGLAEYEKRFEVLRAINEATPGRPSYCILCIVRKSDDKLVGSGTLLLEHKFIRASGSVGHIEDIVVDPTIRGKNLGKLIIASLTHISEKLGAYKTILDCNKDNIRQSLLLTSSFFSAHYHLHGMNSFL
jgi:glucosamine-phosphate N-acetyltransferase